MSSSHTRRPPKLRHKEGERLRPPGSHRPKKRKVIKKQHMMALLGLLIASLVFFQIRVLLGISNGDGKDEAQTQSQESIDKKEEQKEVSGEGLNVSAAGLRGSDKNDPMKHI